MRGDFVDLTGGGCVEGDMSRSEYGASSASDAGCQGVGVLVKAGFLPQATAGAKPRLAHVNSSPCCWAAMLAECALAPPDASNGRRESVTRV